MEELAKKISTLDVVIHKHGDEDVLDISPKGIHKWHAISGHEELVKHASETIPLDEHTEDVIVKKLDELSRIYPSKI